MGGARGGRKAVAPLTLSADGPNPVDPMAIPQSRTELLAAIDASFDALREDLGAVRAEQAAECSMEGHVKGTWMSPANLVAYLLGWNELVLTWLARDAAGAAFVLPEQGYGWNQLGPLAQKFYRDHADVPWPELLGRLATAKESIASAVRSRTEQELYGRAWYRTWTMGRMIQLNTASPYANARRRLRRWLKERPASAHATPASA